MSETEQPVQKGRIADQPWSPTAKRNQTLEWVLAQLRRANTPVRRHEPRRLKGER